MYQKTVLVGNVGKEDAIMRYTPAGKAVANFSVATSRKWTNGSGEQQEKTTWFKVVCWGKLAEVCAQYVKKGMSVLVEGEVDVSAYSDKEGNPHASLELTAVTVKFLGKKGENGSEEKRSDPDAPFGYDSNAADDIPF